MLTKLRLVHASAAQLAPDSDVESVGAIRKSFGHAGLLLEMQGERFCFLILSACLLGFCNFLLPYEA